MAGKEDVYRYIKIGGLASFIPFVLVSGPVVGYFAGSYLKKAFGLGDIAILATTSIGLVFSMGETFKIIKKLARLGTKK